MFWARNGEDSTTHYISFDYYAEEGANITQFLDVPRILRLDINETGRHNVKIYYDLAAQEAYAYLDNNLTNSLLTILAWPETTPYSRNLRIANQISLPGGSQGEFWIDNLVWQGDVDIVAPVAPVPEPATMLLFGTGIASLFGLRRKKR